jgi:hypothetical protein
MKLSKGKINRIINKKKNSKNIKKRKYKRTDTCNNKAKRHLANRTLKCYKSKKHKKKSHTSIGGGGNDYIINPKELDKAKETIDDINKITKRFSDWKIIEYDGESNDVYENFKVLLLEGREKGGRSDAAQKITKAAQKKELALTLKSNTVQMHKDVIKKLKKEKEMGSASHSNCNVDLSIALLKITSEIINKLTKQGYITVKMISDYEEKTMINIRKPKFALKEGNFLVIEPPNTDTKNLAFAEKMMNDRIKELEDKLNKTKSSGICNILMGNFGMISNKLCAKNSKGGEVSEGEESEGEESEGEE